MQPFPAIQIHAVQRRLLGHQNELLHPLLCQLSRLVDQFLHGYAAVSPPHLGDNAVGTVLVAPFRDFQIRIMAAGGEHPLARMHRHIQRIHDHGMLPAQRFLNGFSDIFIGSGSQHRIHLFDLLGDLLLVPLGKTSCHDQRLARAGFPVLRHLENGVDAFLLGIIDKAARVDDDHIRFRLIVRESVTAAAENPQHRLGIHQILVTSQGNKQYFHTNINSFTVSCKYISLLYHCLYTKVKFP